MTMRSIEAAWNREAAREQYERAKRAETERDTLMGMLYRLQAQLEEREQTIAALKRELAAANEYIREVMR